MIHQSFTVRVATGIMAGWMAMNAMLGVEVLAESGLAEANQAIIATEVQKELKRLVKEGFLDDAIKRGVESYIREQRVTAAADKNKALNKKARNLRPVSMPRDHLFGDPDAPISLVEYSDFECPFCKRFHPTVKKLILENKGKVNWVYRHFPLAFHNPGAQKQAEATECAAELGGNDIFWDYTDAIYQRTTSNGKGFPIDKLVPLARELGLDGEKFRTCLDSGSMAKKVFEDREDGKKAGITGTPGHIFIHHKSGRVIGAAGALPLARLQASVDRLLSGEKVKKTVDKNSLKKVTEKDEKKAKQ